MRWYSPHTTLSNGLIQSESKNRNVVISVNRSDTEIIGRFNPPVKSMHTSDKLPIQADEPYTHSKTKTFVEKRRKKRQRITEKRRGRMQVSKTYSKGYAIRK